MLMSFQRNVLCGAVARGRVAMRQMSTKMSPIAAEEVLKYRNFSTITPNIEKEIELYSKKKQTSVSIQSLMESGRGDNPNLPTGRATKASDKVLMQVACFLHRELPVRLAHRAVKLESYPVFNKSGKYVLPVAA